MFDIQDSDNLKQVLRSNQGIEALRARCLQDFKFYCQLMFYHCHSTEFHWMPHHERIKNALMRVFVGDTKRLLIMAPPQSGKSVLVVPLFASWCFAHNPGCRFMNLSRSDDLVLRNSNECKMFIKSPLWQAMFDLTFIKDSVSVWHTEGNGQYHAIPLEGQVTGKPVGCLKRDKFGGALIIDDPVKAKKAMFYHTERELAFNSILDAQSRLATDLTPIILAMQGTHEDDPAGRIKAGELMGDWEHVIVSALDDDDQSFWPEKLSSEYLIELRSKGLYFFETQYQQRTMPPEGGLFKRHFWKFYTVLPKITYRIIVADTAMKTGKQNDYTVFACWGLSADGNAYLIDLLRDKVEAPELRDSFSAFCNKHKNSGNGHLRMIYVEDKASGTGLLQDMSRMLQMPITPIKRGPDQNKLLRANDIVGYISSGYVYLNKNAHWLSDFLIEHSLFPNGKHDDMVDTTSDGVKILLVDGKNTGRITVI